jgi:hypothetical protein
MPECWCGLHGKTSHAQLACAFRLFEDQKLRNLPKSLVQYSLIISSGEQGRQSVTRDNNNSNSKTHDEGLKICDDYTLKKNFFWTASTQPREYN